MDSNSSDLESPLNVVLVGFMGVGKSAVGRRLARRLGRTFIDTDRWITDTAGMSIPEIFRQHGEQAFRDLESSAASDCAAKERLVVSTGGGLLGRPENRQVLAQSGILICLIATPEVILRRTYPWDGRPMLQTAPSPREAVEKLLADRSSWYSEVDLTVDTSDLTPTQVVDQLCEQLPSLFRTHAARSSTSPPD